MNHVTLIGRLGRDPELRYTQGGSAVCNFSLATTARWSKDGQSHERTDWHRIVVWGRTAENCEKYLAKGRRVAISGELVYSEWEDKHGQKRTTAEVKAFNVEFLDSADSARADYKSQSANDSTFDEAFSDEDIPF